MNWLITCYSTSSTAASLGTRLVKKTKGDAKEPTPYCEYIQ